MCTDYFLPNVPVATEDRGGGVPPPPSGQYRSRSITEVFSTDWSFGVAQDECRFGDGADSLRAQSDAVECRPAGLEQRDRAFALGAQTADIAAAQRAAAWSPTAITAALNTA